MSRNTGTPRNAGHRPGKPANPARSIPPLPPEFFAAVRLHKRRLTRNVLLVSIATQRMWHFHRNPETTLTAPEGGRLAEGRLRGWRISKQFIVSTSRFGIGQREGSNKTPLGLHRIARKIGANKPGGTVFKGRKPIGTIATLGKDKAMICHRILWLDGLEPGFNRGGNVDTFSRYIYIHGFGDETTLGRPQSHGCIHVGAKDLLPLFDALPRGTLVWIQR